jgi:hypothetical protein
MDGFQQPTLNLNPVNFDIFSPPTNQQQIPGGLHEKNTVIVPEVGGEFGYQLAVRPVTVPPCMNDSEDEALHVKHVDTASVCNDALKLEQFAIVRFVVEVHHLWCPGGTSEEVYSGIVVFKTEPDFIAVPILQDHRWRRAGHDRDYRVVPTNWCMKMEHGAREGVKDEGGARDLLPPEDKEAVRGGGDVVVAEKVDTVAGQRDTAADESPCGDVEE